jgi:tetratricopeptide (TPR) repeat protein
MEREDWDEARRLGRHMAEFDEGGIGLLLEAEALLRQGKATRAAARFEEAIEALGPRARPRVAGLYRELGDPEQGLTVLRDWAENQADVADARFHLGAYLYEMDRVEESERELREALRLDPHHDRALNYLGYSLAERKIRLDEALRLIERALEIDAWNGAYLDSLGWVYFQMGRYESARPPLERAARELPRDATVLEHLGDLYHALGDLEGAVTAWNRALESGTVDGESLRVKIRRVAAAEETAADASSH